MAGHSRCVPTLGNGTHSQCSFQGRKGLLGDRLHPVSGLRRDSHRFAGLRPRQQLTTASAAAAVGAYAAPAQCLPPLWPSAAEAAPRQQSPSAPSSEGWSEQQLAKAGGIDLGWPQDVDNRYFLGRLLGEGSFGTVSLARDRQTGHDVAVKGICKSRKGSSTRGSGRVGKGRVLARIEKEVQILASLMGCPNACQLQALVESDSHAYIIMEYVDGGDLDQLLRERGHLTERETALIVYQVLTLLAHCHSHGLYHGDVKPANFLLAAGNPLSAPSPWDPHWAPPITGWLKGIDFGCSSHHIRGEPFVKMTGTPAYMAPEVFARSYGLEADIWSAGILFFQLMTGRFPFWDTLEELLGSSLEAIARRVCEGHPVPLDSGPWLSFSAQGLDLIQRMLAYDPEDRISAGEALQHGWFEAHGIGPHAHIGQPADSRCGGFEEGNIVPMRRSPSGRDLAAVAADLELCFP